MFNKKVVVLFDIIFSSFIISELLWILLGKLEINSFLQLYALSISFVACLLSLARLIYNFIQIIKN